MNEIICDTFARIQSLTIFNIRGDRFEAKTKQNKVKRVILARGSFL
jgi:hypothetical protein